MAGDPVLNLHRATSTSTSSAASRPRVVLMHEPTSFKSVSAADFNAWEANLRTRCGEVGRHLSSASQSGLSAQQPPGGPKKPNNPGPTKPGPTKPADPDPNPTGTTCQCPDDDDCDFY